MWVAGGAIGAVTGFAGGFVSSVISQHRNGERFNPMKAVGSGLRGGIEFGVKGALLSTKKVSSAVKFAGDFIVGTVGSAIEQGLGTGKVNLGESLWGGVTNAVSGLAYGYKPIKSAAEAGVTAAVTGSALEMY